MPGLGTEAAAGQAAFGSALRRYVRSESIKLPPALMTRSAWHSAVSVAVAYVWTAAAVTAAIALDGRVVPTIATGFVAILLAQRSMQTLVHHLSHDLLSKNRAFNDRLGNFLVAGFIGMRIQNYRRVHFVHHAKNGSTDDPEFIDFSVVEARGGMLRYMLHHVIGGETFTLVRKYYAPKHAASSRSASRRSGVGAVRFLLNMSHVALAQLVLIVLFAAVAHAWYLYAVWVYVAVTWSPMISKLRFLVEHPGTDDRTVTTKGPWYELLVFAPFQFNYHFEHHVWPSLPPYKLRQTHRQLDDQGFFSRHPEYTNDTFVHALRRRAAEAAEPAR